MRSGIVSFRKGRASEKAVRKVRYVEAHRCELCRMSFACIWLCTLTHDINKRQQAYNHKVWDPDRSLSCGWIVVILLI